MTFDDVYRQGRELGLRRDEVRELTFSEFWERCEIFNCKQYRKWRHTRLLYGALVGKDPRFLIPLPEDEDYWSQIEILTPDKAKELFEKRRLGEVINGKGSRTISRSRGKDRQT